MAPFHIEDFPPRSPFKIVAKKKNQCERRNNDKMGRKRQILKLCGKVGNSVANFPHLSLCPSGGSQYS